MKTSRREFLKMFGAAAAGTVGVAAYGHLESKRLTLEKTAIPVKGLAPGAEGFKIVQITDIHLYPYTTLELVQEAVEVANSLNPDVTVLTGDYVWRDVEAMDDLAPALAALNARHGIFSIIGNHDIWTDVNAVKSALTGARIPILDNEGVALSVGKDLVYLAGIDDGWSGRPDLNAALENRPADAPVVLLAHEPDLADRFSLDGRIALQLSGHSHGGQVRLPGIGAIALPRLGEKYDQGLYNVNGMQLYTNRGLGTISIPARINCPPEVTEITLVSVA